MTNEDSLSTHKTVLQSKLAAFGVPHDESASLEVVLEATGALLDRLQTHIETAGKLEWPADLQAEAQRHTRFLEQRSKALARFKEAEAATSAVREVQLAATRSLLASTPYLSLHWPRSTPSLLPILYLLNRVNESVKARGTDSTALSKLGLLIRHLEAQLTDQDLDTSNPAALSQILEASLDLEQLKSQKKELDRLTHLHLESQANTIALYGTINSLRIEITKRDETIIACQHQANLLMSEAKALQDALNKLTNDLNASQSASAQLQQQLSLQTQDSNRFQTEVHELRRKLQKQTEDLRAKEAQSEGQVKDIREKDNELHRLRLKLDANASIGPDSDRATVSQLNSQPRIRWEGTRTANSSYLLTARGLPAEPEDPGMKGYLEVSGILDNCRTATQSVAGVFNKSMGLLEAAHTSQTGQFHEVNRQLASTQRLLKEQRAASTPLSAKTGLPFLYFYLLVAFLSGVVLCRTMR